jgi:mono/diheme cytochrome c family protein
MRRLFRHASACVLAGLALLSGCGRGPAPAVPRTPGAVLYLTNCSACHQPDGHGIASMYPPLAATPVTLGDPATLLAWVLFGERPPELPKGAYAGLMPQFGYLSDADAALILTHVRSSFGNHASAVTPAMVAAARAVRRGR